MKPERAAEPPAEAGPRPVPASAVDPEMQPAAAGAPPSDGAPDDEAAFPTGQVLTIAGGHFVHDTYSAFVAPLLPLLQERLSLSYTLAGGLAVFPQLPGLLNPLVGYLADRISLRYFVILAPAVTATLVSALGLASGYLSLALLLLAAGVSIAAFHAPAPAMIGQLAGRRVGTGMSIFMAAGELGRTLGPVAVVAAVGWLGFEGLWRLMFVGWAVSAVLYVRLARIPARATPGPRLLPWRRARRIFPALTWLMLARVPLLAGLTVFLPLFVSDVLGRGLFIAAASLTLLEAAGVVGALFTGTLSDRLGRRRVLLTLLALSPPLLVAFLYAPAALTVPIIILLGLVAISPTPVLLAIVQDEFPEQRALANGTFLAVNFLVRALGIWLVGVLADLVGLERAFLLSALAALLALPALAWLRPSS